MPLSCMCTGEIAALCPGRESTVLRFIQVRSKPKGREQRAAPARSSGAGATVHHRGTRPARSFSEQLAGWARASLDVKTVDSLDPADFRTLGGHASYGQGYKMGAECRILEGSHACALPHRHMGHSYTTAERHRGLMGWHLGIGQLAQGVKGSSLGFSIVCVCVDCVGLSFHMTHRTLTSRVVTKFSVSGILQIEVRFRVCAASSDHPIQRSHSQPACASCRASNSAPYSSHP